MKVLNEILFKLGSTMLNILNSFQICMQLDYASRKHSKSLIQKWVLGTKPFSS